MQKATRLAALTFNMLGRNRSYNEKAGNEQQDTKRKGQPWILRESCNNICKEGHGRHQQSVGQLCGNVIDMVALSARACHDGGI